MRKVWLPLALLAGVLLGACASAAPAATATPTQPPKASLPTSAPARCTVESTLPNVSPTDAARFVPVSGQDWIEGPVDAKVTLLEYSDFM